MAKSRKNSKSAEISTSLIASSNGSLESLPKLKIETAPVFGPLCDPARYKGAWGGRGSGKSHFFAELMVEECYRFPGTRAVCVREVQKTLRESSKAVIEE